MIYAAAHSCCRLRTGVWIAGLECAAVKVRVTLCACLLFDAAVHFVSMRVRHRVLWRSCRSVSLRAIVPDVLCVCVAYVPKRRRKYGSRFVKTRATKLITWLLSGNPTTPAFPLMENVSVL